MAIRQLGKNRPHSVDVQGPVELGDFTTNSRVILLSIIAVGIGCSAPL